MHPFELVFVCVPSCVCECINNIIASQKDCTCSKHKARARTHTHRLQSLLNSLNYVLFESQNALWSLSSIIDWQHVGEAEQNFISLHCYKPGFFKAGEKRIKHKTWNRINNTKIEYIVTHNSYTWWMNDIYIYSIHTCSCTIRQIWIAFRSSLQN